MHPPWSDKEKFWKFFAYDPENSDKPTNNGNTTNKTPQLSVLQANIDALVIFTCFETYSDLCVCETEIKHTSNDTWEEQATRYHYKQKPKNSRKPLLPSKPPTAVFCGNNLMSLGALRYLIENGMAAGEDVAIIGFDDIDVLNHVGIPLSVVDRLRGSEKARNVKPK